MRIKRVEYAGKADVWNMEVDDTHDFVIQGGVIAHNCADEVRYFCMARPITPSRPKPKKEDIGDDPLDLFSDGYSQMTRQKTLIRR